MTDDTEAARRVADLQAQLAALAARLDALEGAALPHRPGSSPDRTPGSGSLGRRALFAGVAGAAAGALLAGRPAAAADGDALLLGATNTSTMTTTLSGGSLTVQAQGAWMFTALSGSAAGVGVRGEASLSGFDGDHQQGPCGVYGTFTGVGKGTGVLGAATAATGSTFGVAGYSTSEDGIGVLGSARLAGVSGQGARQGVQGAGGEHGVYGLQLGPSGQTEGAGVKGVGGVGVVGQSVLGDEGWAVVADGRLKSTGRTFLGAPGTAPKSAELAPGSISFYLDAKNSAMKVRVKFHNGTVKTATLALK